MMQSEATVASEAGWEHFLHDAVVGMRGFGATAAEAFEKAAQALTAAVTDAKVDSKTPVEVRCEAPDLDPLFVEPLFETFDNVIGGAF